MQCVKIFRLNQRSMTLNALPLVSAAWRQLQLPQLTGSSHPTCHRRGRQTRRSQALAVGRPPSFRDATPAGCRQSLAAPAPGLPGPRRRARQGRPHGAWSGSSCRCVAGFRQALAIRPAASQNPGQ